MVIVRGVNLYPSAIDRIVRTFPEVTEYEVTIKDSRGMKEVTIRAECEDTVAQCPRGSYSQYLISSNSRALCSLKKLCRGLK